MARNGFFTGLDIGTSSIKVLVAEFVSGEMNVIGVSNVPSTGVKDGIIIDIEAAAEAIKKAVEQAEEKADRQRTEEKAAAIESVAERRVEATKEASNVQQTVNHMPGDDVDRDCGAVGARVSHRRVLREDRDALLALEVHRVHDPVVDVGAFTEGTGLPQHGVDERRLSMVDVGDDGDVSQVFACGHG